MSPGNNPSGVTFYPPECLSYKINEDKKNMEIKYPRNQFARKGFQNFGKLIAKLLTRTEINGMENYPKEGKLIVVGNHTGAMETVLMTAFAPRPLEFMGSVDIPHQKFMSYFMDAYKYIPVYRGNVSRESMEAGVSVLKQGGVISVQDTPIMEESS